MDATWAGRLWTVFGVLGISLAAKAEGPAPPRRPFPRQRLSAHPPPRPWRTPRRPPPRTANPFGRKTNKALKRVVDGTSTEAAATSKEFRKLLEDRLRSLDDWDEAIKVREMPTSRTSPEVLAAKWKSDLERATTMLVQAAKGPQALLPAAFLRPAAQVNDAALLEMKEAIDAAKVEVKELQDQLKK